ncbi:hypothetical protein Dda_4262 [Drechslerella dactyloides]|uniref:Long chronological lifespan protein 2 n=1 Tax=Drechslerella dactyloides TaxID=74499 RepID=A0AAD6NKK6_DREDA|nr:hypothetical protein Dda_4262 [Drechslerella dactyloides]
MYPTEPRLDLALVGARELAPPQLVRLGHGGRMLLHVFTDPPAGRLDDVPTRPSVDGRVVKILDAGGLPLQMADLGFGHLHLYKAEEPASGGAWRPRQLLVAGDGDADELAFRLLGVEVVAHVAGAEGVEGVVAADADVLAGEPEGAALAEEDHALAYSLACIIAIALEDDDGRTSRLLGTESSTGRVAGPVGRAGRLVRGISDEREDGRGRMAAGMRPRLQLAQMPQERRRYRLRDGGEAGWRGHRRWDVLEEDEIQFSGGGLATAPAAANISALQHATQRGLVMRQVASSVTRWQAGRASQALSSSIASSPITRITDTPRKHVYTSATRIARAMARLAVLLLLAAPLLVAAQFGGGFFEHLFERGDHHQQQRQQDVGSDSSWYRQVYHQAHCSKYLCPGTLSCVDRATHCPCAFPDNEVKFELSDGSKICVSRTGKADVISKRVEMARKGLL